ncbi:hypothetical protein AB6A40_000122 [Gnathostoma spinigerum]|uniref:NR LBD domain-containing protein n=1 Tax=Gnathostoma spinigerum TaxID=75299 RepID=A0ABD6E1J6_9BILA
MCYEVGRVATVEQLCQATKRYLAASVEWINALFEVADISDIDEKVCVLKSSFAAFCIFSQAARTAQTTTDSNVLCLCNKTVIPRQPPRHLLETNFLSNNLTRRILDELVRPMRRLILQETEIVALMALIMLDADAAGTNETTLQRITVLRSRIQHALFQLIRDSFSPVQSIALAIARFGNILLLLPPLAKLSSLMAENVQFAKMFGVQTVDPLLTKIFIESDVKEVSASSFKEKTEVSTQTEGRLDSHTAPDSPQATLLPTALCIPEPFLPDATFRNGYPSHAPHIPPIIMPNSANRSYNIYFPYSAQFHSTGYANDISRSFVSSDTSAFHEPTPNLAISDTPGMHRRKVFEDNTSSR